MLQAYLLMPETLVAVLVPGLASLWAQAFAPLSSRQWLVFAVCTMVSLLTVRWDLNSEAQQLFIVPAMLIWLAYEMHRGVPWSAPQAFAATFFSLWVTDMLHAANGMAMGLLQCEAYYSGVGGAGARDSLFILPLLAAALASYVRWRRRNLA